MFENSIAVATLPASDLERARRFWHDVFGLDPVRSDLRVKGVTFHDYDLPDLKTENGVMDIDGERGAWFDDSEGNIIALAQPKGITMDEARSLFNALRA
jgi:predicted enzyme related to lactoylglutathione lyase